MIVVYRNAAYDLSKATYFGLHDDTELVVSFGDDPIRVVAYNDKKFAWDAWIALLTALQRRITLYELPQEVLNDTDQQATGQND